MNRLSSVRGFTFLELIVVVLTLIVLTSLGFAEFHKYQKQSYDTVAITFLRQFIDAQETCYVDKGYYCDSGQITPYLETPEDIYWEHCIDEDCPNNELSLNNEYYQVWVGHYYGLGAVYSYSVDASRQINEPLCEVLTSQIENFQSDLINGHISSICDEPENLRS